MQLKPTLLSLSALSLLTTSITAIITGVTAPATITAGEEFTITLTTADYIQTVYDVGAVFGISPAPGYPDTLGAVFASEYLGPALSNTLDPIHFTVSIDESTPAETALISVAVLSLYGVSSTPVVNTFNTTVTVV